MTAFTLPINNRDDMARLLLDMIRPLKPFYSEGSAWLQVGNTAAHYGEKAARMEGFARILWGLGPLWAGDNQGLSKAHQEEIEWWKQHYLDGLIHGTDPNHMEYWGEVSDYDQKMVEMAALAVSLGLCRKDLWDPLTKIQKEHLYRWLDQINDQQVHPNNWRFFRILVNMTFRLLDLAWNRENMDKDIELIESCYMGDGWYFDGTPNQVDYYIPFAIHFYGLIYGKLMAGPDPEYTNLLKERSRQFGRDFVYWFGNDGNEVPFGRSLTYRFAHTAFWGAAAFAEVESVDYGVMKNLVLSNLERWLSRPIFDPAGILSIGYGYPNLLMSERYNAPGSPYWAFKAFIVLALPATHPFWTRERRLFPFEPVKYLEHPRMVITHAESAENDHVLMFPAAQHGKVFGNSPSKYEKFVYSNRFGFSVSRGFELDAGAFDNVLAVSVAEANDYRMRNGVDRYLMNARQIMTEYHIGSQVKIISTIIPGMPWHVRIHEIETQIAIDVADGGFTIGLEPPGGVVSGALSGKATEDQLQLTEHSAFAVLPWGVSGIESVTGGTAELVRSFPNTNLLVNLGIIPTVRQRLEPGEHVMVTLVCGEPAAKSREELCQKPEVEIREDGMVVLNGQAQAAMPEK